MFVIKSQVLNGCVDASLWGVVKGDFHASEYWASFLSIRNNHTSKSFGFALLQYILSFWQIAECQERQAERVQSCFDEIQKQKSIDVVKAQSLWDVAIKMNASIDSTNVLVANLKPRYWAPWLH